MRKKKLLIIVIGVLIIIGFISEFFEDDTSHSESNLGNVIYSYKGEDVINGFLDSSAEYYILKLEDYLATYAFSSREFSGRSYKDFKFDDLTKTEIALSICGANARNNMIETSELDRIMSLLYKDYTIEYNKKGEYPLFNVDLSDEGYIITKVKPLYISDAFYYIVDLYEESQEMVEITVRCVVDSTDISKGTIDYYKDAKRIKKELKKGNDLGLVDTG